MMTGYGMVQDQNLEKHIEKQMGCMAGFLHIFDRHHILSGKKRLPPSKVVDSGNGSDKSGSSTPAVSRELVKPQATPPPPPMTPPPEKMVKSPVPEITPPKSPLPLPVFEMKDGSKSSWKYCKETPRLSLDSRATIDAKGSLHPREIRTNSASLILTANADDKQRSSPSVIARLMGLEPLQADFTATPEESAPKNVQLRRSASESRVARDLFCYHPVENNFSNYSNMNTFHSNLPNSIAHDGNNSSFDHADVYSYKMAKSANSEPPKQPMTNRGIVSSPWKAPQSRRSYFDAADVFPEPKQQVVSICGDIEKRLKLRGIDEPSKDLETLKQILESLQLKGLLHSHHRPSEQRNFVYDRSFWSSDESPIVLMRPSKSPVNRRLGNESPPSRYRVRRNLNNNLAGEYQPSSSPRRERPVIGRDSRSPTGAGKGRSSNSRSSSGNSITKPKPLTVETRRSMDSRRVTPAAHSPKLSSRRNVMSQDPTATNQSPRRRRSPATNVAITEDESSSISESTISTPSQTDTERSKMEVYREGGKSLLERCDKLLHSIAEMNNAAAAAGSTDMQPSPVSVLDSAFFRDESSSTSSPSPVMKRSIDFKENEQEQASDLDLDEEAWSYILRPDDQAILGEMPADGDLVYISEILVASRYLPEDCDVYLLLEKQQYLKGNDSTKVSRLQRRLIFDIIVEILDQNRNLPPWMAFSWSDSRTIKSSVCRIWSEFLKIRERDTSDQDLLEVICGVLKKDLAGDATSGWGDCSPVELSEAVLDIERLIFKDLIGESIRDLAAVDTKSKNSLAPASRRKLNF